VTRSKSGHVTDGRPSQLKRFGLARRYSSGWDHFLTLLLAGFHCTTQINMSLHLHPGIGVSKALNLMELIAPENRAD